MKRIPVLTVLLMLFVIAPASAQDAARTLFAQDFFNDFVDSSNESEKQIGTMVIAIAYRSAVVGVRHGMAYMDENERLSEEVLEACLLTAAPDFKSIVARFRVWLLDNEYWATQDLFLSIAAHAEDRCTNAALQALASGK